MTDTIWYYAEGDQQRGPVAAERIRELARSGRFTHDDLVWREGFDDWTPAGKVPELLDGIDLWKPPVVGSAPSVRGKQAPSVPSENADAEPQAPPVQDAPAEQSASPPVAASGSSASASARPAASRAPAIATGATGPAPAQPQARAPAAAPGFTIEPLRYGRIIGQPLLLLGLVLVLGARGCESVGSRGVARKQALAEAAPARFQHEWDRQRQDIESERDAIRAGGALSANDQDRLDRLDEKLKTLNDDMRKEQGKLRTGRWAELQYTASQASANNLMWSYWRESAFVFGSVLFTVGLLAVGFTGQGADRWICLIMLAIIVYSLYIGNSGWLGRVLAGGP
jgi:hypothetical protein